MSETVAIIISALVIVAWLGVVYVLSLVEYRERKELIKKIRERKWEVRSRNE